VTDDTTAKRKKRKRRRKVRAPAWTNPLVTALVEGAVSASALAGLDASSIFAGKLGGAFGRLPFNRKRFTRATDHIAEVFPDMPLPERHRLALEGYRHLFRLAVELTVFPRVTHDSFWNHIELGDVEDVVFALRDPRPTILITSHAGNWELLGHALCMLGIPLHAVYRPLDNPSLDRWVRETRARSGLTLVDKFGASTEVPRLLNANLPVGFIADQNAGDRGLFVPFFGRMTSTYKSIGVLAVAHRARVICGQAVRLSGLGPLTTAQSPIDLDRTLRYRLDIVDVIEPETFLAHPDPVFYITARYRRAIEKMVRAAPEQYLWMHRYWKSRPRWEHTASGFPPRIADKLRTLPWMNEDELARIIRRSDRDAADWAAGKRP
jgi:KDO2-lipid IV(A) lauroyltransferase